MPERGISAAGRAERGGAEMARAGKGGEGVRGLRKLISARGRGMKRGNLAG